MKSNVRILLLALVALTLLGWYQVLGVTGENKSNYDRALEDAERCAGEGAYEKALDAYYEALTYEDNPELRRSMNELFLLCMEDGSVRYTAAQYEKFLSSLLSGYPDEAESYERSVAYWYEREEYLKCHGLLQQAEKKEVSSEVLGMYKEQIQYRCELNFTRYTEVYPLSQGRMTVCTTDVWNYISGAGNILLAGNYEEAWPFGDGLAIVRKNGTLRIIAEDGTVQKTLDRNILSAAGGYGDGMAPVRTETGCGYMDREGKQVLGSYERTTVFCNGVAAVMADGQWQIIDTEGSVILGGLEDVVLDGLGRCSACRVILASANGGYALYALDGKKINEEEYEAADAAGPDGITAVEKDGLWGYIDTEGNWILEPRYEAAKSFCNGLAGVREEGLWGFIDRSGEIVIECAYEDVDYWNEEGCCMVLTGGFWRLLRRTCV